MLADYSIRLKVESVESVRGVCKSFVKKKFVNCCVSFQGRQRPAFWVGRVSQEQLENETFTNMSLYIYFFTKMLHLMPLK